MIQLPRLACSWTWEKGGVFTEHPIVGQPLYYVPIEEARDILGGPLLICSAFSTHGKQLTLVVGNCRETLRSLHPCPGRPDAAVESVSCQSDPEWVNKLLGLYPCPMLSARLLGLLFMPIRLILSYDFYRSICLYPISSGFLAVSIGRATP